MPVNISISAPKNTRRVVYKDGNTMDIIATIIWADKYAPLDTKKFAQELKGKSIQESAYNVWKWVKTNIHYILDPVGEQYIKAPAKTNQDGFADCKSRSLFMASLLKNLGIPYAYRFASYSGGYPYTHVYVVAKPSANLNYILDPDMPQFNMQKPTTYFKDYNMSRIEYLAGIGANGEREGKLTLHLPADQMTELDMDLAIRKQREEINKSILENISGIGCPHAEKVQDRIDAYKDIIEVRSNPKLSEEEKVAGIGEIIEDYDRGAYHTSKAIAGIGNLADKRGMRAAYLQKMRAQRKARVIAGIGKKKSGKPKKKGGLLKKVGAGLKKVGKGLLKVATVTQRLAIKGVLEVALPKMAPMFIYLFIKDPAIIAKLPEKARKKRKTSERLAKFIVKGIGMKEDHFMGIIRNGIMKRYHKSPEALLSKSLGQSINGIGAIGFVQFIPMALGLITKIMKLFKKPAGEDGNLAQDLQESGEPDLDKDFAGSSESEKKELGRSIMKQEVSPSQTAASDGSYSAPDASPGSDSLSTDARTSKIC